MATDSINSAASTIFTSSNSSTSPSSNLGIDDFFKLMAAQLENQSMFDTVDNTQFLAQLAQFSTLSQMTELASAVKTNTAISLIGKQVTVPDIDNLNSFVTGTVEKVAFSEGIPYVFVNGCGYAMSDLLQIESVSTVDADKIETDTNAETVDS